MKLWIFLFNFTFLNGIVYKTTLTFMSSETLVENKLAAISTLKSSNDVELVRSYLRDIGRVPLLSHEQEITLGRQVQEYMQVERAEIEIIELTDNKPSAEELAEKLNLSTSQIKKRLRAGQRAKERMVAANLRLVVSVAKKYTKRNSFTSCFYPIAYRYWRKCWSPKLTSCYMGFKYSKIKINGCI